MRVPRRNRRYAAGSPGASAQGARGQEGHKAWRYKAEENRRPHNSCNKPEPAKPCTAGEIPA